MYRFRLDDWSYQKDLMAKHRKECVLYLDKEYFEYLL
jgi:hypothetical protein